MSNKSLNELAQEVYEIAANVGFHKDVEPEFGDFISNLHGEVSELWESYRKGELFEPCDKEEKMKEIGQEPLDQISEEIADIIIRALDTAHTFGVDVDKAIAVKCAYNKTRPYRHGNKKA